MRLRFQAWSMISSLLRRTMTNASAQQMLCLSLAEQKNYFAYLIEQNRSIHPGVECQDHLSPVKKNFFRIIHSYFQLPCSPSTRARRAQWLEDNGFKDKRIFLMGDDDLVAAELGQRGFPLVTAADCDPKVLSQIRHLTQGLASPPIAFAADFSHPSYAPTSTADVVCLDPPYNLAWATIFLKAAFQSFPQGHPGMIVMMLNPTCLSQKEWQALETLLTQQGFRLVSHLKHFNAYPLTGISKWAVRAAFTLFASGRAPVARRHLYFGSDLFAFQRA